MSITNINGIPFIWDDEGDKNLFKDLFPQGIQPPKFKTSLPLVNSNGGSKLYKDASPFADYQWKYLKRDHEDIHHTFFTGTHPEKFGAVTVAQEAGTTLD